MVKTDIEPKLVILVAFIFLGGCKSPYHSPLIPPGERAQKAVSELDSLKQKAMLAREISVKALENAYAALHEAQRLYLKSLKSYSYSEIESARAELAKIQLDVDDATKKVEEMSRLTAEAISSANNAIREAQLASSALTAEEAENSANKAEQLAKIVRDNTTNAVLIAEQLKEKWLLPPFAENK
jgi:DNA repair exonuclease SbcCD ATPase subunit